MAQSQHRTQQNVAGSNYFCCGNPWDDIFGGNEMVQNQTAKNQEQPQSQGEQMDWNNPYGETYMPYGFDERRHVDEGNSTARSGHTDARSTGSGTHRSSTSGRSNESKSTAFGIKSLRDIEREQFAMNKALQLQESLMHTGKLPRKTSALAVTPILADRDLAEERHVKIMKKNMESVRKTETTRKPKDKSAEDVRDPETVAGMKGVKGVAMEETAKKKAVGMINNGEFRYDDRAGVAIYSANESSKNTRKTDNKVMEIV